MRGHFLCLALFGPFECLAALSKNKRGFARLGWKPPTFVATANEKLLKDYGEGKILQRIISSWERISACYQTHFRIHAAGRLTTSGKQYSTTFARSLSDVVHQQSKFPKTTNQPEYITSNLPSLSPSVVLSLAINQGARVSDIPSPAPRPIVIARSNNPSLRPSLLSTLLTIPGALFSDSPSIVPSGSPSFVTIPGVLSAKTPSTMPSLLTIPTGLLSEAPSTMPTRVKNLEASSDVPSQSPSVLSSYVTLPGVLLSDAPSLEPSIVPLVTIPAKPQWNALSSAPTTPRVIVSASDSPSISPSVIPSYVIIPGVLVSDTPSLVPSIVPSAVTVPTVLLSQVPNTGPITKKATASYSDSPSLLPSMSPSFLTIPGALISDMPSIDPSDTPSLSPSTLPSSVTFPGLIISDAPSLTPSDLPSTMPSMLPSSSHTPSDAPSVTPSDLPSSVPSSSPTSFPSATPSSTPSHLPSARPSDSPSNTPSRLPSGSPTRSSSPSLHPSFGPSPYPSSAPSAWPSGRPRDVSSNGTITLNGISSIMNAGNITIFEKTAKAFLEKNVQSVEASHVDVTSFQVIGQSVVGSARRRLQQASTGLEIMYRVEAILFPGHSKGYNFSGQVATTFQAQRDSFQQTLSQQSPFFPAPLVANSVNGQHRVAGNESHRRITIFVIIGGVVVIALFFLFFTKKSFRTRQQREVARRLANRRHYEREINEKRAARGPSVPNFIDGSFISSNPARDPGQSSLSGKLAESRSSEKHLQMVLSLSNEAEACPMCFDMSHFEKVDPLLPN